MERGQIVLEQHRQLGSDEDELWEDVGDENRDGWFCVRDRSVPLPRDRLRRSSPSS